MIKSLEAFEEICRIANQDPKSVVRRYMRMDDCDISVSDARAYGFESVDDFQDAICDYSVFRFKRSARWSEEALSRYTGVPTYLLNI